MQLFITADDFGYCPERNAGIIDCFKAGAITDTSLMVNASYSRDAARLGNVNGLPMGLHFNISEGTPLSPPHEIPTLLDDHGLFRGKLGTKSAAENGELDPEQIRKELCAQLEEFKSLTGKYPRRVDGHQHVHVFPGIRDIYAQVLQQYGVVLTRIPDDPSLMVCDWMESSLKEFLMDVASHSKNCRLLFADHEIATSDAFIGSSLMNYDSQANMTLDHLDLVLGVVQVESPKTCELMVHPGYPNTELNGGCGSGPDEFSKDISRQWELDFLTSPELKNYFHNNKIQLASWESTSNKS